MSNDFYAHPELEKKIMAASASGAYFSGSSQSSISSSMRASGMQQSSSGGGNNGGPDMEPRIARIESDIRHIQTSIVDIKTDIRDLRSGLKEDVSGLRAEIKEGTAITTKCIQQNVDTAKHEITERLRETLQESKGLDSRISDVESSIKSAKRVFYAGAAMTSAVFGICAYIFGSYISRILEVVNSLVLK